MGSPTIFNGSRTKLLTSKGLMLQSGAAIDFNGPKNYIGNGSFENNSTTGWGLNRTTIDSTTKFPNQASASWTSAAGTLSATAVSSGALSGSYSLSLASSAATTAGDMLVSNAFTVDPAGQAAVLSFSFTYQVSSGAGNGNFSGTSSNSFGVAIYDATNNAWVMPAGVFNIVAASATTAITAKSTGTFQLPINCTSARLAIYFPNASSGAITMLIDDVFVGPQVTPLAPAVSDWQNYTPTGSWTTNTAYVGRWRRDGDSMELDLVATLSGAPNATTFTINLPSGFSIDTAKLSSTDGNKTLGFASMLCAGAYYQGNIRYNTTTSVAVAAILGGSANNHNLIDVDNIRPATFASGDRVYLRLMVPISGWSSNSVASSDTDTRVVAMQAKKTATQAVTANTTNITTNTTNLDTHGAYDGTTYTVPVAGNYYVNCTYADNASNSYIFNAYVNAVSQGQVGSSAAGYATGGGMLLPNLKAGDAITIRASATQTVAANGNLSIQRLSGPAVITATDTVACRYTDSSGQAISNSYAVVKFATKDFDTTSSYSTSTGLFTVPVSGKYAVITTINTTTVTLGSGIGITAAIYKNGSVVSYMAQVQGAGQNVPWLISGSDVISCVAGDTLGVYCYSGTSTTLSTTGTSNHISIVRVGN